MMELYFYIKRDLAEPYFKLTDTGIQQTELLELKDKDLEFEIENYIDLIGI